MPKTTPERSIDQPYATQAARVRSATPGGTVQPVQDHGGLLGLADDDHTQYINTPRGDARYAPLAHTHAGGGGDMLKVTYDTDDDGTVDAADYAANSGALETHNAAYFATSGHAHSDIANSLLTAKGDLIIASGASTPARYALSVPAANLLNVLGVANGEDTPTWKALFDATAPAAVSLATASAGTSLIAAHRDHTHQVTASSNPGATAAILQTTTAGALQVERFTTKSILVSASEETNAIEATNGIKLTCFGTWTRYTSYVNGFRARGTVDSPTASVTDDSIFQLIANAYDGAHYQLSGGIDFRAAGTVGAGSVPGKIAFVLSDQSNTMLDRAYLTFDGVFKVGSSVVRGTTEGTNHIDIFDGAVPVGTLTNGISILSYVGNPFIVNSLGHIKNLMGGTVTKTGNYTATVADCTILIDATSAPVVITLPVAASSVGLLYNIKKIDSSANGVTIDANASELIDGALTQIVTKQYVALTIQCDGTGWYIL